MSFEIDKTSDLDSAIHQTLGFASVCWTESPTGIFESEQCHNAALKLKEWIEDQQPWLGYATNMDLINELYSRFEIGHTDADYRTMG